MTLPASQVIPKELQQKWQKELEALDPKLGGTPERPISSLLVTLEAPNAIVVLCTAGSDIFYRGGGSSCRVVRLIEAAQWPSVTLREARRIFFLPFCCFEQSGSSSNWHEIA